jgi:hypothetical protein
MGNVHTILSSLAPTIKWEFQKDLEFKHKNKTKIARNNKKHSYNSRKIQTPQIEKNRQINRKF